MVDLTPQQALWLLRVADGRPLERPDPALARAALVRGVSPEQADSLRRYLALLQQAEASRQRAHAVRKLRVVDALLPWLRRGRETRAEALGMQADDYEAQARGHRHYLSSHGLLDLDLALLSPADDGSVWAITDAGRDAVWDFIYSAAFERDHASAEGLQGRIRRFLGQREGLLAHGLARDPLLDLAAAAASRVCSGHQRVIEFNRLATAARWQSYDRLPLVALLALNSGEPPEVWKRFWGAYQALKQSGCAGGYEARLAAMLLQRWGEVDEAACDRVGEIARKLRYHGWSLGPSTEPVAARLAGVRLSPTQVVARVVALVRELARGAWTVGPYLDLAAGVAAGSNLHRLAARAETAQLMEATSRYGPFVDRYDAVVPRAGEDSRPTLSAALLALFPGAVAGNVKRHQETVAQIAPQVDAQDAPAVALLLIDSAYPDWCDATQFVWEIGALLQLDSPTTAFGAFGRMGAMYQGMAARAEMSKPEGPAAGPG